jgi:hypothetical protein
MTHGAAFSGPARSANLPFLSKPYEKSGLAPSQENNTNVPHIQGPAKVQ